MIQSDKSASMNEWVGDWVGNIKHSKSEFEHAAMASSKSTWICPSTVYAKGSTLCLWRL